MTRFAVPAVLFFSWAGSGLAQVHFTVRMVAPCDAKDVAGPMKAGDLPQTYCLERRALLTEADVESAEVARRSSRGPAVRLTLTDAGSRRLLAIARTNIGNRLGLVLNGRLISAPLIQAPVSNGIQLTGLTQQEAEKIAADFNRRPPTN